MLPCSRLAAPGQNRKHGIFGALELEGGAFHYTDCRMLGAVRVNPVENAGCGEIRVPGSMSGQGNLAVHVTAPSLGSAK